MTDIALNTITARIAEEVISQNWTAQQAVAFLNEEGEPGCKVEGNFLTFGKGGNSRFTVVLDLSGQHARVQGGQFVGDLRQLDGINTILLACGKPLPEAIATVWEESARHATVNAAHRSLREMEDKFASIARDFGGEAVAAYLLKLAEEVKDTKRVSFKSQDDARRSQLAQEDFKPWYNG